MPKVDISVFDFFSGCGGTSAGLRSAGMNVVLAVDNDPFAAETFRSNFEGTKFIEQDLAKVDANQIADDIKEAATRGYVLFSACAPCQPFSRQNSADRDLTSRRSLLLEFLRFVEAHSPDLVFVENVPGLQDPDEASEPFGPFVQGLRRHGYHVNYKIVDCRRYGVPQRRLRLVLLASKHGDVVFPRETHGPGKRPYTTVRDWIADLPPVAAGEEHPRIRNHRAMGLSDLNLERIRATPPGGDRRHWPKHLLLACHQRSPKSYTDVYGRMTWDAPATGLTTRCISLSNGRFGHPEQDRAITVREAALLQTFPRGFTFKGPLAMMGMQVGNAVPVLLARAMGMTFNRHVAALARQKAAS